MADTLTIQEHICPKHIMKPNVKYTHTQTDVLDDQNYGIKTMNVKSRFLRLCLNFYISECDFKSAFLQGKIFF